ncbi:MAG: Uma2 family endonuclease [Gemmataceae bacterium]
MDAVESQAVHELENGREMDQPTFHRLYKRTPEGFKAELIGGIVHVMASPVSARHGRSHARIVYWLSMYSEETPGTEGLDDTTNILARKSEPQPDACLYVLPENGGSVTFDKDGYLKGAADLVVEVANSTTSIDLGRKKEDYERYGVREYVVVLAKEESARWFVRSEEKFHELEAERDGIFRSAAFPGLWLDPRGLFAPTTRLLSSALRRGLASPEHGKFVAALRRKLQSK